MDIKQLLRDKGFRFNKQFGQNFLTDEYLLQDICNDAGIDGGIVANTIMSAKKANYGYDAQKEVYCDMVKAGILDPTKVTRSALQNAASVASTLLTTESLVTDIKEPAAVGAAPTPDMY